MNCVELAYKKMICTNAMAKVFYWGTGNDNGWQHDRAGMKILKMCCNMNNNAIFGPALEKLANQPATSNQPNMYKNGRNSVCRIAKG